MSWGTELWDRGDALLAATYGFSDELNNVLGKFLKERGELEREYAKGLRKLISKFGPKETKDKDQQVENLSSQTRGFKCILKELGFQAGQHEVLAEALMDTMQAKIKSKVKELHKVTDQYKKEMKNQQQELDQAYKGLDKIKTKYAKACMEWYAGQVTLKQAEGDGTISRNEVEKLRNLSSQRVRQCEEYKSRYAQELVKTNKAQDYHYQQKIPGLLDQIQLVNENRGEFFKKSFIEIVQLEKQVGPIMAKCQDDMLSALECINPSEDSIRIIERLKTGNLPPQEILFEEMSADKMGDQKVRTLGRKKSRQNNSNQHLDTLNQNLFQRKRELNKKIEEHEGQISKGQKEIKALQLMVQTYKQNPKFGDWKKFQSEIETVIFKVQTLEADMHALNQELDKVNMHLQNGRENKVSSSHLSPDSFSRSDRDSLTESGSIVSSNQSYNHSLGSNSASSSERDCDSVGELSNNHQKFSVLQSDWGDDFEDEDNVSLPPPPLEDGESMKKYQAPPPPPPDDNGGNYRVTALYNFSGDLESNLSMLEGDQFILLEEDQEGWSRVGRLNGQGEGYVPTSFIKRL